MAVRPFRRLAARLRDPEVALGRKLALVAGLGLAGVAVGVVALALYVVWLIPTTPSAERLERVARAQPSLVLDAGGTKLTQFEAAHREWVPLDSVPLHVVHALIATEDRRFYTHRGLDLQRTAASAVRALAGGREGGSTITQQLARNLFPEEIGRAVTPRRKLREMITAVKIERRHTKRDILEAYLNSAAFLYNATGIELAARTYFSRPASALTVGQAATLVAMLKGPSAYNPVRQPERSLGRRNLVLALMAEQGLLDPAEAARLRAEPLGLRFAPQPGQASLAPHFTAAVRERAEAWAATYGYDLDADGLVIHTTLDLGMQQAAEAAVREQAAKLQAVAAVEWSQRSMPALGAGTAAYVRRHARVDPFAYFWNTRTTFVNRVIRQTPRYASLAAGLGADDALARLRDDGAFMDSLRAATMRLEAGLVALDPRTGDVRAYVGGRDFRESEYDHVTVARRQPGSVFKAVVYAAALQRGYDPADRVVDEAVEVDLGGGRVWRPTNAGRITGAEMSLADALAYSKNTVSVQLAREVGISRVALVGRQMGVTESRLRTVPALALGASEVTLMEMASVYGTVANEGLHRAPRLITRIEAPDGRVLATFGTQGEPALTRREARSLLHMLRGVVQRGTGTGVRAFGLRGDWAGKTGTSQRGADGWFMLMHPHLVVGGWVGFDEPTVTFRSSSWGQGGHNALLVVGDFARRIQDRLDAGARFPDAPPAVPRFDVAAYDSLLADPGLYYSGAIEFDAYDDEGDEARLQQAAAFDAGRPPAPEFEPYEPDAPREWRTPPDLAPPAPPGPPPGRAGDGRTPRLPAGTPISWDDEVPAREPARATAPRPSAGEAARQRDPFRTADEMLGRPAPADSTR